MEVGCFNANRYKTQKGHGFTDKIFVNVITCYKQSIHNFKANDSIMKYVKSRV